ncbi:MAG: hypothetical protein ACOH5I_06045 [Oligoflexus sp.]
MEKVESRPQGAVSAGVAEPSPHIIAEEVNPNRLVIYITRPEEAQNCHFWIGLFRPGPLRPPQLLTCETIDEIYDRAALEGLNDQEPILIADTSRMPARGFYLWPYQPKSFSQEQAEMMADSLVAALEAMRPRRVGIYFSPDLVNKSQAQDLMKQTILKMRKTSSKEYYLYAGAHGVNMVLNTALEIKAMLADQNEVLVFH